MMPVIFSPAPATPLPPTPPLITPIAGQLSHSAGYAFTAADDALSPAGCRRRHASCQRWCREKERGEEE